MRTGWGIAILGFWVGISPAQAKIQVYSALPTFAEIVAQVGGDAVNSFTLTAENLNPHSIEPKSDLIPRLQKADLLVVSGLELEVGWLPPMLIDSKNAGIQRGTNGYLELSSAVKLKGVLAGEKLDLTRGDTHPAGNPHYMLDPRNGVVVAHAIAARLALLDPPQAAEYNKRAGEFEKRLNGKIAVWEKVLKRFAGKSVVSYHAGWTYFIAWAGMEEIATIEIKPGVQATPESVVTLIGLMKAKKCRLILMEPFEPNRVAQRIAKKTKAQIVVARTEPGVSSTPRSYIAVIDELIGKLARLH